MSNETNKSMNRRYIEDLIQLDLSRILGQEDNPKYMWVTISMPSDKSMVHTATLRSGEPKYHYCRTIQLHRGNDVKKIAENTYTFLTDRMKEDKYSPPTDEAS